MQTIGTNIPQNLLCFSSKFRNSGIIRLHLQRYNKEYEQYYIYALEQFLINTYGYSEYDAKVKVMQDFDEVKEDFELKEIK